MNRYKTTLLLAALSISTLVAAQNQTELQPTRVRIGETILTLQPPLRVRPVEQDSAEANITLFAPLAYRYRSYHRFSEEMYLGFGFVVPMRNADYLSIHSGNSFHLDIGFKHLYHPSQYYAIGVLLQYGCYSYRMVDAAPIFMDKAPRGEIYREYFRTDNIGTGLVQRVRLFPRFWVEGALYGDWAFSKRYKVKSRVDGSKEKSKYRDGEKFNPFGAGAQAGVKWNSTTLYARYRFTNFFNPDYIPMEVPRLSIGVCFTL